MVTTKSLLQQRLTLSSVSQSMSLALCLSFFSCVSDELSQQKQLAGERVDLGSQFREVLETHCVHNQKTEDDGVPAVCVFLCAPAQTQAAHT